MSLLDRFKKYYEVPCRCFNCGFSMTCRIPKGNTIDSWLKTPEAICSNCGNPTLSRMNKVYVAKNAGNKSGELSYEDKVRVAALAALAPPLPSPSPRKRRIKKGPVVSKIKLTPDWQTQEREQRGQIVEFPVDRPIQQFDNENETGHERMRPEKPKKINFWGPGESTV